MYRHALSGNKSSVSLYRPQMPYSTRNMYSRDKIMIIDTRVRIITKATLGSSVFKIRDAIGAVAIDGPEVRSDEHPIPTIYIKYIDNGRSCSIKTYRNIENPIARDILCDVLEHTVRAYASRLGNNEHSNDDVPRNGS